MTRKEIESLGWTECPTPEWLKVYGRFVPDRMWVIDKPMPRTMSDGHHKTYYLDYGMLFSFGEDKKGDPNNYPRFTIHKEATGGFAGGTTQGCIFAGRSMYCAFWDATLTLETLLVKRTEELRLIMIMTGVMSEPKTPKSGDGG